MEVLHSQEELREVCSLEEPGRGAVCRDGLVVFTLRGEGVREADPRGSEVRVHEGGFGEESPRFCYLGDTEVVDSDREPGGWFVGVEIGEAVREQEKGI